MANWFKKLFGLENEEEEEKRENQRIRQADRRRQNIYHGQNQNAKVVYEYPKGQFRFPLIPDEKKVSNTRSSLEHERKERIRILEEERHFEKNRQETAPLKKSKPFKPTEVPSPVYGFHRRPSATPLSNERNEHSGIKNLQNEDEKTIHKNVEFSSATSKREPMVAASSITEEEKHVDNLNCLENYAQDHTAAAHLTINENDGEAFVQTEEYVQDSELSTQQVNYPHNSEDSLERTDFAQKSIEVVEPIDYTQNGEADRQTTDDTDAVVQTEYPQNGEAFVQRENYAHESDEAMETIDYAQIRGAAVQTAGNEQNTDSVVKTDLSHNDEAFVQRTDDGYESDEAVEKINYVQNRQEVAQPVDNVNNVDAVVQTENPQNGESIVQRKNYAQEGDEAVESIYCVQNVKTTAQTGDYVHNREETFEIIEDRQVAASERQKIEDGNRISETGHITDNTNGAGAKSINQHASLIETKIQATEQIRKRSGFPFNVIMLKQDRQMLNNKTEKQNMGDHSITKPPLSLLEVPPLEVEEDEEWLQEQSRLLDQAFESFHVGAKVVNALKGPSVTRFEIQPDIGVRVNKITSLADDLKLALAAKDIRIEAPIPGKSTVGIEVPNRKCRPVLIREILRTPVFQKSLSPLVVALGLDIAGQPIVTDIGKMPHGLIAGATGSGKSVCINSIIISLLYKASPHEVKLMLIDPKMVELAPYNGIPHLVSPVITDVKAATAALKWAVEEMDRRYELFAHEGVRDINRFNEKVRSGNVKAEIMPYIVIIIDELADLMMVAPGDVEDAICRIAQKARACGIHLLLATQRPSVDVITGLIKSNIPTRIAFSVSSQVDSRTIIDMAGAEKLLGRGDMLFVENGSNKPVRIQGNFVKDEEIERVTQFVKKQMKPNYLFVQEDLVKQVQEFDDEDELFDEACRFVIEQGGASASSLQRRFRIGYNRAARLIEMMEARGFVSEAKGSKPREVLISLDQFDQR